MQINTTGQNIELTESLHEYVETKFKKLERFFHHINHVHVVLKLDNIQHIAEATLNVNQGELHASADANDMYIAIDALIDKLTRQLNKHKEKLSNH